MSNPILVDERVGSKELIRHFDDAILVRLEFGDMAFIGNGCNGKVEVGVERKKIGDLVNSVLTGRLAGHQIPGMVGQYDVVYLVVEGLWRQGERDCIEEYRGYWGEMRTGRLGWKALWSYLTTLEEFYGVRVRTTSTVRETVEMVEGLARWWDKPWDGHKVARTIYTGVRVPVKFGGGEPSVVRKVASVLPGVGIDKGAEIEKEFRSVREMVEADEKRWMEVKGIGKVTAKVIKEALNGERPTGA